MSTSRTVLNPFSKEPSHLKRNTRDTRWITSNTGRSGPKPMRPDAHQRVVKLSQDLQSAVSGDVSCGSDKVRHTDLRTIQTHCLLPNVQSRKYDVGAETDASRSGNATSSSTEFSNPSSSSQGENTSMETIWPTFDHEEPRIASANRVKNVNVGKIYKCARHIYADGPKNEAQLLQEAAYDHREELDFMQISDEAVMTIDIDAEGQYPYPSQSEQVCSRKARALAQVHATETTIDSTYSRKFSQTSPSSSVLTIGLDRNIQPTVNFNKSLPSIPRSQSISNYEGASNKTATDLRPPQQLRTSASDQNTRHAQLKAQISHPRPITAFRDGRTANLAIYQGGIGGPNTFSTVAASNNTLHPSRRPPEVVSKRAKRPPALNLDPPSEQSRRGKQTGASEERSGTHWRAKLIDSAHTIGHSLRSRRDSDMSFACVGLPEATLLSTLRPHGRERGYGMQRHKHLVEESFVDGDLLPRPLFSERKGGRSGTVKSSK